MGISSLTFAQAITHARSSAASYVDAGGSVLTQPLDVPRFEGGRLLVEAARQNLYPDSVGLSYGRALIGVTQSSAGVAAAGLSFEVLSGVAADYAQYATHAAFVAGKSYGFSAYFKAGTAQAFDFWVGVGVEGLGRVRYFVDLGAASLVLVSDLDGGAVSARLVPMSDGVFRLEVVVLAVSSDDIEQVRITGLDGTLYVGGLQVEAGGVTSYLSTGVNGGAASSDVVSADVAAFDLSAGSLAFDFTLDAVAGDGERLISLCAAAPLTDRIDLIFDRAAGRLVARVEVGGVVQDVTGLGAEVTLGVSSALAVAWDAAGVSLSVNGGAALSGVLAGAPTLDTIAIGAAASGGGEVLRLRAKAVRLFERRLDEAGLIEAATVY